MTSTACKRISHTEKTALAESGPRYLPCPSASSRDGEITVAAFGVPRYRQKSAAQAEHGWYRGYFRPMIFSWGVFISQ